MKFPVLVLLTGYLFSQFVSAQNTNENSIEVYIGPKLVEPVQPRYPVRALRNSREGWVVVNFMVNTDGQPFEPTVVDSVGHKDFENAALEAIEKMSFSPAKDGDKAINGSTMLRITFKLDDDINGAGVNFIRNYRRFIRSINEDDQDDSIETLEILREKGVRSLYEEAYLNLAGFSYAQKYEDEFTQMKYLSRALYFDNEDSYQTYLPREETDQLWPILYTLQVRNNRFVEALETFEIIKNTGDENIIQSLTPSAKAISELRENDAVFTISAKTSDQGSWGINLLKDEFYLENAQSNIDEIKLRCEKNYVFFKYEQDIKYNVPRNYGKCHVEIIGDANASFNLVQL